MTMTSSSAKRVAFGGLFVVLSLMFSYMESLVPLNFLLPIPGFKLGLANVCVMLALYYLGTVDAFIITLLKSLLTAMLFGTPMSFVFSLVGGLFAFCFLLFAKYIIKEKIGFIGISVACAALHNFGQVATASVIFKDTAIFWYMEWLLPVSIATGIITGLLAVAFGRFAEKRI
ncbi:MAG: Gx transporter family protein [Clostridia bacterium]|nr:Gx transporter family protein [Clostridia bacterium]